MSFKSTVLKTRRTVWKVHHSNRELKPYRKVTDRPIGLKEQAASAPADAVTRLLDGTTGGAAECGTVKTACHSKRFKRSCTASAACCKMQAQRPAMASAEAQRASSAAGMLVAVTTHPRTAGDGALLTDMAPVLTDHPCQRHAPSPLQWHPPEHHIMICRRVHVLSTSQ